MARKPCVKCQKSQAVRPGGLCNRCFGEQSPVTPLRTIEKLPINSVVVDHEIQSRVGLNEATVAAYVEDLANGAEFPPAVVFVGDADEGILAAGFHRYEAWSKAGFLEIPCEIREGSRRDAQLYAIGDNAEHGLRRTREDMRRAVEMLLADEEWGKLSVNELARLAKVNWATADRIRSEWHKANAIPEPETRTSSDGKQKPAKQPRAREVEPKDEPADPDADSPVPAIPLLQSKPDEPTPVFDVYDCPVPTPIQPAWETGYRMKAACKAIAAVQKEIESLRGKPGADKLSIQTVLNHLENAKKTTSDAVPRNVCPSCDGLHPKPDCTCSGRGWIAAAGYDALPLNLKRQAERYSNKRAA